MNADRNGAFAVQWYFSCLFVVLCAVLCYFAVGRIGGGASKGIDITGPGSGWAHLKKLSEIGPSANLSDYDGNFAVQCSKADGNTVHLLQTATYWRYLEPAEKERIKNTSR